MHCDHDPNLTLSVGSPGLPNGTKAGTTCDEPVNLMSLYATLTQLTGLPNKETNDGPSLVPLLKDPNSEWPHVSITYLGKPGNYGLSDKRWRYSEYENGDSELDDIRSDRYEWFNLAAKSEHTEQVARLKTLAPSEFAKFIPASIESLPKLKWDPANESAAPALKTDGKKFDVFFCNKFGHPVKVFWVDLQGKPKPNGTGPGAVWFITDADDLPLGYLKVGERKAHAIIPAKS